jgi:hypothetical protein
MGARLVQRNFFVNLEIIAEKWAHDLLGVSRWKLWCNNSYGFFHLVRFQMLLPITSNRVVA